MRGFKVLVLCLVFLLVASLAIAGEVDVLTKKLVEKGILTAEEAKAVLADTKESVKKQLADGKLDSVPAWAQNTKFSGDLRFRFENRNFTQKDNKDISKNRERIRFRYGFTTKVSDKITVGARLATGSDTQNNSNEQTLDNAFGKRAIWLDLAYLDYKFNKNLKLLGGKFANPFYRTSEIIWGAALNPEGGALQYTKTVKPAGYPANIDLFVNAGILPLDTDTRINPIIYALQGGAATNVFDRKLKTAVAYYYFAGIENSTRTALFVTAGDSSGNTLTGGKYLYDYHVLDVNAEYPLLDIKLLGRVLPLGIYGNYVKNVAQYVKKDSAWLGGFKLGAAKDPGTWDFSYSYRRVESDATLDFINDASFHASGTNAKGHLFSLNYIPSKNTTLTLNYFNTERAQKLRTAGEELNRLQLEYLVKF
jgi:hypothetical protein